MDLSAVDGVDRIFESGDTGHEDSDTVRRVESHPFEKLHAHLTGQLLIGQNDVHIATLKDALRFLGTGGDQYLEVVREEHRQHREDGRIVIDHQNGALVTAHDRSLFQRKHEDCSRAIRGIIPLNSALWQEFRREREDFFPAVALQVDNVYYRFCQEN